MISRQRAFPLIYVSYVGTARVPAQHVSLAAWSARESSHQPKVKLAAGGPMIGVGGAGVVA
jgi:hypothetical protein